MFVCLFIYLFIIYLLFFIYYFFNRSSGTWEVWSPSHNLAYAKQLIEILRKNATRRDDGGNVVLTTEEIEWLRQIHKMKILERVKEAVDTRPTFPCLVSR